MATPPDFSVGQVLTAAQMNAVGLWKITPTSVSGTGATINSKGSVEVSSGGTSVSVEGVFTSDFDAYEIIVSNFRASAGVNLAFRLRVGGADASTSYYWSSAEGGASYAGTGTISSTNNSTSFLTSMIGDANATGSLKFFVNNVALAQETTLIAMAGDPRTNGTGRVANSGFHNANTAYTGFTFLTGSATTITSLKISVYGYN